MLLLPLFFAFAVVVAIAAVKDVLSIGLLLLLELLPLSSSVSVLLPSLLLS